MYPTTLARYSTDNHRNASLISSEAPISRVTFLSLLAIIDPKSSQTLTVQHSSHNPMILTISTRNPVRERLTHDLN